MEVVAGGVVGVDHQVHAVLVDQVLELLFHEADHHSDICDPDLLELFDAPLDQALSVDFYEALGRREVDGHHAHAKARREDDRVPRSSAPDLLSPLLGELAQVAQIAVLLQLLEGAVDDADAVAEGLSQHSLVYEGCLV